MLPNTTLNRREACARHFRRTNDQDVLLLLTRAASPSSTEAASCTEASMCMASSDAFEHGSVEP